MKTTLKIPIVFAAILTAASAAANEMSVGDVFKFLSGGKEQAVERLTEAEECLAAKESFFKRPFIKRGFLTDNFFDVVRDTIAAGLDEAEKEGDNDFGAAIAGTLLPILMPAIYNAAAEGIRKASCEDDLTIAKLKTLVEAMKNGDKATLERIMGEELKLGPAKPDPTRTEALSCIDRAEDGVKTSSASHVSRECEKKQSR